MRCVRVPTMMGWASQPPTIAICTAIAHLFSHSSHLVGRASEPANQRAFYAELFSSKFDVNYFWTTHFGTDDDDDGEYEQQHIRGRLGAVLAAVAYNPLATALEAVTHAASACS